MKATAQRSPVTFHDALEAIAAFSDADGRGGFSPVAILAPLFEVAPSNEGDFCAAHGPFGYEPLADGPTINELPPTLASLTTEVAAELGLSRASTPEELHRLRREFMWRNHPDRRPDLSAQWSNARVAVANMLIDRALEALASRRRAPV